MLTFTVTLTLWLMCSTVAGVESLTSAPLHDVTATQNHQQLSELLAAGNAPRGIPQLGNPDLASRHITLATTNITGGRIGVSGGGIPGGIVTTLGQVPNNIVTLSRQGNIALVQGGTQGMGSTVIGGHRAPHQPQQLVAINPNAGGATLLSVSSSNAAATMARLQPNLGATVMSLTAAGGMVINVSQGMAVSANGNHVGPPAPTLVMARGVMPAQFTGSGVAGVQHQQQQQHHGTVMDGLTAAGLAANPATQMTLPTVAAQQMGTRVRHLFIFLSAVFFPFRKLAS